MGHVRQCAVWPNGSWSVQLSLSPSCDQLASGNPRLFVEVMPATARPDAGENMWYSLMITQDGVEETMETKRLGHAITSPAELGGGGRSVDNLQGVRRIAERNRQHETESPPCDLSQDGSDGADDEEDVYNQESESQRVTDILIDVCWAPPATAPLTLMRKFSSPLTLLTSAATFLREPGRLWVVVPAEKTQVSRRVSV